MWGILWCQRILRSTLWLRYALHRTSYLWCILDPLGLASFSSPLKKTHQIQACVVPVVVNTFLKEHFQIDARSRKWTCKRLSLPKVETITWCWCNVLHSSDEWYKMCLQTQSWDKRIPAVPFCTARFHEEMFFKINTEGWGGGGSLPGGARLERACAWT